MALTRIQSFTHTQTEAASVWNVQHNLNTTPVVDIWFDDAGTLRKMLPLGITVVDSNNITITFSTPYSGVAGLAG